MHIAERKRNPRAIRTGNQAYIVSIGGAQAAWLKNIRANANVRLRISGGTFAGIARELPPDTSESEAAMLAYCETVYRFDYDECRIHRPGRPTASKIKELHRSWFTKGIPVAIQLYEQDPVAHRHPSAAPDARLRSRRLHAGVRPTRPN